MNSNTKLKGVQSSKKTLVRRKSIVVVYSVRSEQSLHHGRFQKASKFPLQYWQYFNADILTHS